MAVDINSHYISDGNLSVERSERAHNSAMRVALLGVFANIISAILGSFIVEFDRHLPSLLVESVFGFLFLVCYLMLAKERVTEKYPEYSKDFLYVLAVAEVSVFFLLHGIESYVHLFFLALFCGAPHIYTLKNCTRRHAWMVVSGALFCSAIILGSTDFRPFLPYLEEGRRLMFSLSNGFLTLIITGLAILRYQKESDEYESIVADSHARSNALLLNILPRKIAARLKAGEDIIAERYENATIVFADLVGFTPLASGLGPEKIVSLLNQLFSRFDTVAEAHEVEKIKTIGDAYMFVSGLPDNRADHAAVAFAASASLLEEAEKFRKESGHDIQLRIGMSSGPVVAGVIGKKKFIFDCWGDAVNTAARMEEFGKPGGITMSNATFKLLGVDDTSGFTCDRQSVDIRGKGEMQTFAFSQAAQSSVLPKAI